MDYDCTEAEELIPDLQNAAVKLARRGWYDMATLVDQAATRMRLMEDEIQELRDSLRAEEARR